MSNYKFNEIFIDRSFAEKKICSELVTFFNENHSILDVKFSKWGDPRILEADIHSPEQMLKSLININQSVFSKILQKYFSESVINSLLKYQETGQISINTIEQVLKSFNQLNKEKSLLTVVKEKSSIPLEDPLNNYLETLNSKSFLIKSNEVKNEELSEAELFELQWLNNYLIQNFVFPGSLKKTNNILKIPIESDAIFKLIHEEKDSIYSFLKQTDKDQLISFLDQRNLYSLTLFLRHFFSDKILTKEFMERQSFIYKLKSAFGKNTELNYSFWNHYFKGLIELPAKNFQYYTKNRNNSLVEWRSYPNTVRIKINDLMNSLIKNKLESHFSTKTRHISEIVLYRYEKGTFFVNHNDSEIMVEEEGEKKWVKNIDRDLTALLYLSDRSDFSGGDLYFTEKDITIKPEQGMAVIFPSDHRYSHEAKLVESGFRYVLAAFIAVE